jgi:hypothetical protein
MRIVHIEDLMFPEAGYQINQLARLQVKQGHEVFIVSSELKKVPNYYTTFFGKNNVFERDNFFFKQTGAKVIRIPLLGFYSGRSIYYLKIFKIVDDLNPDALFVHGEDTLIGIQYIWRYSKLRYPLILDCHMVEMASINKFRKIYRFFYKRFIAPIIIKNKIPLIRTVDVDYVEKHLGIPLKNTTLLSFGTDTDLFKPNEEVSKNFRVKYNVDENDFVVIYAGKLDIHKGGLFLAESIKNKLETSSGRKIVFVIIGNTDGEYGKKVEYLFSKSENRIIRFPTQAYSSLPPFYQSADMALYPKQCSLSFFEVQSCGLPVVFEENEINIQRSQFNNGVTYKLDDTNDFRSKILYFAEMNRAVFANMKRDSRKYIVEKYNFIPIAQKFTDIIQNEVERFKSKLN